MASWRHASVEAMPPIPVPCTLEFISRLPVVTPDKPCPLPLDEVILLVPGYDPHRDAAGYVFDAEAAAQAIDFFHEVLSHVKGSKAGQPLILELWQQAVIANAYGWKDEKTGLRRYTDVFLLVPRKNGKSTVCGGVVLIMLFCDDEPGAEVYSAAAEKEQAALVFQQAKGMLENKSALSTRGRVYRAMKSIEYAEEGSVYRAISADSQTKHGFNTHCYVMDELHAQKNRNLLDTLETSTGSRDQPMGWIITTADYDGPSICNEKQEYAESVRDGTLSDPTMLPVLYAIPREMSVKKKFNPHSERTMRLANPNYGVSVRAAYLKKKSMQAQATPAFLNTYLRLHLNVRTQSDVAAILLSDFDACPDVDESALKGLPCYGGLDLASTQDLTSFALYWPEAEAVRVWSWLPEDTAHKREERDKVPYVTWSRDAAELLTLTDGNVCDYQALRYTMGELAARYNIQLIAYDRFNSDQIVTDLTNDGHRMAAFGQGMISMSAPTKAWIRSIAGHSIAHEHTKLLRWCASNVMLKIDSAENMKPCKEKSREKIDPAVAWIMAVGASTIEPVKRSMQEALDDEDGGLYA